MTQETPNFITRHIASLRAVAGQIPGSGGLAETLLKSASIIEQVVDGNATLRAEHERHLTDLRVLLGCPDFSFADFESATKLGVRAAWMVGT